MKISSLLYTALAVGTTATLLCTSCSREKNYQIVGQIDLSELSSDIEMGDSIYLYNILSEAIDATVVGEDGTFSFVGSVTEDQLVFVEYGYLTAPVILEKGTINVTLADQTFEVTGTPYNDELTAFLDNAAYLQQTALGSLLQRSGATAEGENKDSLTQEDTEKLIAEVQERYYADYDHLVDSTYEANRSNIVGAYLMLIKTAEATTADEVWQIVGDNEYLRNSELIKAQVQYIEDRNAQYDLFEQGMDEQGESERVGNDDPDEAFDFGENDIEDPNGAE
jgi:hypothetical protein